LTIANSATPAEDREEPEKADDRVEAQLEAVPGATRRDGEKPQETPDPKTTMQAPAPVPMTAGGKRPADNFPGPGSAKKLKKRLTKPRPSG